MSVNIKTPDGLLPISYDNSQASLLVGSFNYHSTIFKNILGVKNDITKIRCKINSNNHGYIDEYYKSNRKKAWVTLLQISALKSYAYHECEPHIVPEDVSEGYQMIGSLDIVTST